MFFLMCNMPTSHGCAACVRVHSGLAPRSPLGSLARRDPQCAHYPDHCHPQLVFPVFELFVSGLVEAFSFPPECRLLVARSFSGHFCPQRSLTWARCLVLNRDVFGEGSVVASVLACYMPCGVSPVLNGVQSLPSLLLTPLCHVSL